MPTRTAERAVVVDYAPGISSEAAPVGVDRRDPGAEAVTRGAALGPAHALGPSTGALLLALEDLEHRDALTGRARRVLAGLLDTDCQSSPRAAALYRALNAWDSAGLGSPTRMSTREHELVYCRVAAALLDQLVADRTANRAADTTLVDEQVVSS